MAAATEMAYSGPESDKQAKDNGHLPCFYSPPIDNYNKNLVRPEDFVEVPTRKKDKENGGMLKETKIRRRGECVYQDGIWQFRSVDFQEVEKRVEVEFDVTTGKAVTENTLEDNIDVRFETKLVKEKLVSDWYKVNQANIEFI